MSPNGATPPHVVARSRFVFFALVFALGAIVGALALGRHATWPTAINGLVWVGLAIVLGHQTRKRWHDFELDFAPTSDGNHTLYSNDTRNILGAAIGGLFVGASVAKATTGE